MNNMMMLLPLLMGGGGKISNEMLIKMLMGNAKPNNGSQGMAPLMAAMLKMMGQSKDTGNENVVNGEKFEPEKVFGKDAWSMLKLFMAMNSKNQSPT